MERKHTNKKILYKGIKFLAISLPLILLGPSVIYSAFNNQNHPLYMLILILGILIFLTAIFFIFRGIFTIVKAVFDE